MRKMSGIDTSQDIPGSLRQRSGEATLSSGAEHSNARVINEFTDGLIARKGEMKKRCEAQLSDLFANAKNSYGRNRAVGLPAREASRLIDRAFKE